MVAALPSLYDPILDLDVFELDKVEAAKLQACQICFDECRTYEVATRICGSGCPACVRSIASMNAFECGHNQSLQVSSPNSTVQYAFGLSILCDGENDALRLHMLSTTSLVA